MIGRVIVAIDVGNTNVTVGIIGGGDVISSRRAVTRPTVHWSELEKSR